MTTREPSLTFERLARAPEVPHARRRMELGAVSCALAGLAGAAPAYALYMWRHLEWLPPEGWIGLLVQTMTFAVAGGAWCGVVIGAGLSLSERPLPRLLAAVVLGAAGAAALGAIGASHFGLMELPYFGGPGILGSIGLAIALAALGFARNESRITADGAPPRTIWRASAAALIPAPAILLAIAAPAVIEPHIAALDLDTMRILVDQLGLSVVGAIGGALVGALGAAWFGSAALLAAFNAQRRT